MCQRPGQCPSGLYTERAGERWVPCRKSPWGCAPGKESLLIGLVNPLYGVKPGLGSGWAGLVSAPSAHTPQHSEISVEAFKSRTFPQKTFCNTSSVLSKQEHSLEELSPESSSLQSGTLPPCCDDRAFWGLSGVAVAILLPTLLCHSCWLLRSWLLPQRMAPSSFAAGATFWGFVWGCFGETVSSSAIKHFHSQDLVIVAPRWEVNSCCCIFLLPTRQK